MKYDKQERKRKSKNTSRAHYEDIFSAPDNFDIENFDEVVSTLFVKKMDLKKKGPGKKQNQSEPLEDHQIEQ